MKASAEALAGEIAMIEKRILARQKLLLAILETRLAVATPGPQRQQLHEEIEAVRLSISKKEQV